VRIKSNQIIADSNN